MRRIFRVKLDYLCVASNTILKQNINGDYLVFISDVAWQKAGFSGYAGLTIKGEVVENTPDVFEDITDAFEAYCKEPRSEMDLWLYGIR